MLKNFIKKLIPKSVLLLYHKLLAIAANIRYGFPSRKMIVIGVTGTKGKSSTCVMITRILEEAGFKVGSTNTIFFKIEDKEWPNTTKQGMPGRLKLQKMLRKMAHSGCTHAVIEVTSEGILQSRQWGIAFDVCVFTNLGEEHIESHGSYEKYIKAKELIFKNLCKTYRKRTSSLISFPRGYSGQALIKVEKGEEKVKKVIIANMDDPFAERFLHHRADEKWATSIKRDKKKCEQHANKCLSSDEVKQVPDGVVLSILGHYINLHVHGKFMAENALLSIAVARSIGVSMSICESALEKITLMPGRTEIITSKSGTRVIIDYAHEPKSFNAIFETAKTMNANAKGKIIAVFGSPGGGRDIGKRPKMGAIAGKYSDLIILTTDDAYDDDPEQIAKDIQSGISKSKQIEIIIDRTKAIQHALKTASSNDIVLLLGKGSEQTMAVKGGKYIPWSDRGMVEDVLKKKKY